jgi:hypothetical protein
LAEGAVKALKGLLKKTKRTKESFEVGLLHLNSTRRASGTAAPSSIFYKREVRTLLPSLPGLSFDVEEARRDREKDQTRMRKYGKGVKSRKMLEVGSHVVYREPKKGSSFKKKATIKSVRDGGRSYVLETSKGKETMRNNKYVRMDTEDADFLENLDVGGDGEKAPEVELPSEEESRLVRGSAVTRAVFRMVPQVVVNRIVLYKSSKVRVRKGPRQGGREHCRMTTCSAGAMSEDSGVSRQAENNAGTMSEASGVTRQAESERPWYSPVDLLQGYEKVIFPTVVQDGAEALCGETAGEGGVHGDEAGHELNLDGLPCPGATRQHCRKDQCNDLGAVGDSSSGLLVDVQEVGQEGGGQEDGESVNYGRDGDGSGGDWLRCRAPAGSKDRGAKGGRTAQGHDHSGPPSVGARLHTSSGVNKA